MHLRTTIACIFLLSFTAAAAAQGPAEAKARYMGEIRQMLALRPTPERAGGSVSEFRAGPAAASLGTLEPFWRTSVMPAPHLPRFTYELPPSVAEFGFYPANALGHRWFLIDSVSTVRLLGGWSPLGEAGLSERPRRDEPFTAVELARAAENDIVYRDAAGRLAYRWNLLHERLDPHVERGIEPLIVLDNVPYCFVARPTINTYGQVLGPDDPAEYGRFIEELCRHLAERYGPERVGRWTFRVGTEPDLQGHWQDTLEKYLATYDHATAAVRRVLPGARVGPGNFSFHGPEGYLDRFFEHIAQGRNHATGQLGSPIDFIGISQYCVPKVLWGEGDIQGIMGASPEMVLVRGKVLKDFQAKYPQLRKASLEVHEFGILNTDAYQLKREYAFRAPEPDARGAAWTFHAYSDLLKQGFRRVFQWGKAQPLGRDELLYGHTWLNTMLEPMVGGRLSVLELRSAATDGTLLKGWLVEQPDRAYCVLSAYHVDRAVTTRQPVAVIVPNEVLPAKDKPPAVSQFSLTTERSQFEVARLDLQQWGELEVDNGRAYPFNRMATKAGRERLARNAEKYFSLQRETLTPAPFKGSIHRTDEGWQLECSLETPSVVVLVIEKNRQ
ncbi:MAG: GH39 family glycosyl hydrolase [Planctomycetota bacterium]